MGQYRSIIKGSPAPCFLIHYSSHLLLRSQVSVSPLLVSLSPEGGLSLVKLSSAVSSLPGQIFELLVSEEGREEKDCVGQCLGLHSGGFWARVSAEAE